MQEKLKVKIIQMSFRPELLICESEELKQREKVHCQEILHEIITHYKNN